MIQKLLPFDILFNKDKLKLMKMVEEIEDSFGKFSKDSSFSKDSVNDSSLSYLDPSEEDEIQDFKREIAQKL